MKITSQNLYQIGELPTDQLREAILLLAMEVSKEERRLSLQRNRTKRYVAKRDFHARDKSLINNDERDFHANGHKSPNLLINNNERDSDASANLLKTNGKRHNHGAKIVPIYNKNTTVSYLVEGGRKKGRVWEGKEEGGRGKIVCPSAWVPSQKHYEAGLKLGFDQSQVDETAEDMKLWSISKDVKRTPRGWDATLHQFLRKDMKRPNSAAMPRISSMTATQAAYLQTRRTMDDLLSGRIDPDSLFRKPTKENAEIPLDQRSNKTLPAIHNPAKSGNGHGNGHVAGGLFRNSDR